MKIRLQHGETGRIIEWDTGLELPRGYAPVSRELTVDPKEIRRALKAARLEKTVRVNRWHD